MKSLGRRAGGGGKGNEICMFCLLKSILPLTSFSVHLFCLFDVMPCIISKMKILEFLQRKRRCFPSQFNTPMRGQRKGTLELILKKKKIEAQQIVMLFCCFFTSFHILLVSANTWMGTLKKPLLPCLRRKHVCCFLILKSGRNLAKVDMAIRGLKCTVFLLSM